MNGHTCWPLWDPPPFTPDMPLASGRETGSYKQSASHQKATQC